MKAWRIFEDGNAWDKFQLVDMPVPSHEDMAGTTMDVGVGYGTERHHRMEEETDSHIKELISRGLYKPKLSKVVSFEEIPEALKEVGGRHVCGRIVARIGHT